MVVLFNGYIVIFLCNKQFSNLTIKHTQQRLKIQPYTHAIRPNSRTFANTLAPEFSGWCLY